MNSSSIRVVLVRPRNPLNIGACARAMANFGFSELVVVDPYEEIWRETKSAPEAESVVLHARAVSTFDEAVKGCPLILATSSFHQRPIEHHIVDLPDIHSLVHRSGKVALVLGSERSGLSNDELARCHAVIRIPTDSNTPSMNLGQAVAVMLYELKRSTPRIPSTAISVAQLEPLIQTLNTLAERVHYPPSYKPAARLGRIRAAFKGAALSELSLRFLLSFLRHIQKKVI